MTTSAKSWIENNRTTLAAAAFTVLLAVLVFEHRMSGGRAAGIVAFCWCLAMHSLDNNSHKAEIVAGLEQVERAGIDMRSGNKPACAEDLQEAAKIGATIAIEMHKEKEGAKAA
jgi:hypothetical protein